MTPPTRQRWLRRLNSLVFYLLLAAAVGLAGWLSLSYQLQWDWTASGRNSLSESTGTLLSRLEGPLEITAFAPESPVLRKGIADLVEPYRQARPDIRFGFVDPQLEPERTRTLGIKVAGELLVQYQGRREQLRRLSEQTLSNAIERLMRRGDQWVVYLNGHGERSLEGQANYDLGDFGKELQRKGFQVRELDLGATPDVPDNTALLVIAGPRVEPLAGEWKLVQDYLDRGGDLLWLTDPDDAVSRAPLARLFGVQVLPGMIIDRNAVALGIQDPAVALVTGYPEHPATRDFEQLTLFPQAAALETSVPEGWAAQPLLRTLERTWTHIGPVEPGRIPERAAADRLGPLSIGHALSRDGPRGEQRVLVIGDGDFISNAYLGNAGNLDLGLDLVRWAAGEDRLLNIPAKTAIDLELRLSRAALMVIGFGFLLVLPLALASTGALIAWRRRRW
jgi:ABC-type uncharacterized transport system involved in gliding motility auxiliary subunit